MKNRNDCLVVNGSNSILINKSVASELLGVSMRTIDRLVSSGELIKVKIRGAVRFRRIEVMNLAGGVK